MMEVLTPPIWKTSTCPTLPSPVLTRAAACLASIGHARATTAIIRRQLITVPARIARSGRRLTLHLPSAWPWQTGFEQLFVRACGPPTPAT